MRGTPVDGLLKPGDDRVKRNPSRRAVCWALAVLALVAGRAHAQATTDSLAAQLAELKGQIDGMNEQVQVHQTDLDKLKRFKFSGYIQARWETAENKSDSVQVTGVPPTIVVPNDERFYIRRGRMKLTYDGAPLSQGVLYLDASSVGAVITVRMLEAYVTLFDPWTVDHRHAFTIGQMNVPFGYEIERSSSVRELMERSRAENVLFPGERDRGAKIVSQWTPQLETVVGIFNGGLIGNTYFPNTDPSKDKDLVARARFSQGVVDVAVSTQLGHDTVPLTGPEVVTDRQRFGADAQTYFEMPRLGGASLRAEYYGGHALNADSLKRNVITLGSPGGFLPRPGTDPQHLATDFSGGYLMAVQNLGERWQLAGRFDFYDPNLDVDHDQFQRWCVAANFFYDGYSRISLEYDVPITEAAVAGVYSDPKDNLWTFQVQMKF
jgi:hypothetical protein